MYRPMNQVPHDVRSALRQFRRAPGLSFAAVLALACGIGGLTTVFTLIDVVLLRPLPVKSPSELVWLRDPSFSYPMFEQLRDHAHMLRGLFAWEVRPLQTEWTSEPEPTSTALVTGAYHDTLGIQPAAGRLLTASDVGNTAATAQAVAVLSYDAWQRRFNGDPAAVGRTLRIEGQPFTIVGVTPPGFFGVAIGRAPELTIPLTMLPRLRSDEAEALVMTGNSWLEIMGRVRPGLSIAEADAAFQPVWAAARVATVSPEGDPRWRERYLRMTSGLEPGESGYSPLRRRFQAALWLLFGLVGLVLIVSCATVANLLLASAASRRRELALRLAIGAGRAQLVQQLFVEGLLLAAAGGALGCLFATWAADLLVALLSTSDDPVTMALSVDGRVALFAVGASTLAAVVFSLAPIVRALHLDPGPILKAGAVQAGGQRPAGIARALVAAQVALSMVLLTGSALFVRSLVLVLTKDAGFDREGLLVVNVDVLSLVSAHAAAGDAAPDLTVWYGELLRRVRETPGVRSASLSRKPPVSADLGYWFEDFTVEGGSVDPRWPSTDSARTFVNAVSPGYFETMGIALVAGRDFSNGDTDGRPGVVVINASMAARHFGQATNAVGRRLQMGQGDDRTIVEVIGVVRDSVYQYLQEDARRIVYVPYMQSPEILTQSSLYAEVRAADNGSMGKALLAAVRSVDASAPVRIETVQHRVDESLVQERLITVIAAFLGAVSLLLACGALGGLMSNMVASRTREIGLRIALGAGNHDVVALVMREVGLLTATGAVAGVGLALAGGRFVADFLHDLRPTDPLAIGGAAALMIATAVLAGYRPARRAASVNPIDALRAE